MAPFGRCSGRSRERVLKESLLSAMLQPALQLDARLDTNPIGEVLRGRLGRVYDAAELARLHPNV